MKWSWKLGEFRGIAVYMHATFLILLAFVAISHWSDGHSVGKTLEGVGFILALFSCVVLHEFGHALMAVRFSLAGSQRNAGYRVRSTAYSGMLHDSPGRSARHIGWAADRREHQ